MEIQEAIGAILRTECLTLSPLVGDRIYWYRPPQSVAFPMIVFREASHRDMATAFDGASTLFDSQIDFEIFSERSIAECVSIAKTLKAWMQGWTGETPSTDSAFWVQRILLTNQEDISDSKLTELGLYSVGQSYSLQAREYPAA